MTEETRSRHGALEVLLGLREKLVSHIQDETARKLLTEELVKDVFREAWRNQFDDQRSEFRNKVKEVVGDAIESHRIGGSKT